MSTPCTETRAVPPLLLVFPSKTETVMSLSLLNDSAPAVIYPLPLRAAPPFSRLAVPLRVKIPVAGS